MKRTTHSTRRKLPIAWQKPTRFKVPIPKDEPERLSALFHYRILDTPPEEDFDQITTLAGDFRDVNEAADAARIAEKEAAIKAKADAKAAAKLEKVEKTPDIGESGDAKAAAKLEKVEKTPDIGESGDTDSEGGTLD